MSLTLEQKVERRRKANLTASAHRGIKVRSVEHLDSLAMAKRSVFCVGSWGLLPASVVMNMATICVFNAIKRGAMFEYYPAKEVKP